MSILFHILALQTPAAAPLRDLPLPLPLPEVMLVFLLVFSFLLHIFFVNLLLGGTLITAWADWKSTRNPALLGLAKEIAATVTVNKSLAVVLGVAPLLSINVLYTVFFYTANILTGMVWIGLVPLVTLAFLLLYAHKWMLHHVPDRPPVWRRAVISAAAALLLFVPLIFLANINLMLFPERWPEVRGFFSAMVMQNVLFRYLHFLFASLAVTGLFFFWFISRRRYDFAVRLPGFEKPRVQISFYKLALHATLAQALFGTLNLITLPGPALTTGLIWMFIGGGVIALAAVFLIMHDLRHPPVLPGRRFYAVALLLTLTVVTMGTGRHLYRAKALAPHREAMEKATARFQEESRQARPPAQNKQPVPAGQPAQPDGSGQPPSADENKR